MTMKSYGNILSQLKKTHLEHTVSSVIYWELEFLYLISQMCYIYMYCQQRSYYWRIAMTNTDDQTPKL